MRYVIGDVHGCALELKELCEKIISRDFGAQFYSVGDLVNKGPDSQSVLDLVRKYKIQCIRGNHENALLKWIALPKKDRKAYQSEELAQYRDLKSVERWIQSLPYYLDLGDFLLVHAGLEPNKTNLAQMSPRVLTTIRYWDGLGLELNNPQNPHWYECMEWEKPIIFGHWAAHGLLLSEKFICLDSGCVYGKELSAICLENHEIIQLQAQKIYQKVEK